MAHVQLQIRARRIRMSEENQALQRQLQRKHEKELEKLKVSALSFQDCLLSAVCGFASTYICLQPALIWWSGAVSIHASSTLSYAFDFLKLNRKGDIVFPLEVVIQQVFPLEVDVMQELR